MSGIKVLSLGDLPPPLTGENLCRAQLEEIIRFFGGTVVCQRWPFKWQSLSSDADLVLVMNRQSFAGTAIDWVSISWALIRGKRVWLYFHNRSWRRYRLGFVRLWFRLLGSERLRAYVLTGKIAEELCLAGYRASQLNNCGGQRFDALAASPSPPPIKRLLWVGRADSQKGFGVALDALAALRRTDPVWRMDVYGAAPQGFSAPAGVYAHGFVSGESKVAAFSQGGVFILPSQYANETQPLSIIEALAAGLPVVASDIGGIPEMLADPNGTAGCVLHAGTGVDYAAAVRRCLEDYTEFSDNARRVYLARYSLSKYREAVKTMLDEIVTPIIAKGAASNL